MLVQRLLLDQDSVVFDTWPAGKQEVPNTITTHVRSVNRSITVVKKNVKLPCVAHMTSSKSVIEPTSVHFDLESMFPGVNPNNHLLYLVDSAASHNFVRAEDMGRVFNQLASQSSVHCNFE